MDPKQVLTALGGDAMDTELRELVDQGLARMAPEQLEEYARQVAELREAIPKTLRTLDKLRARRSEQEAPAPDALGAAQQEFARLIGRVARLEIEKVRAAHGPGAAPRHMIIGRGDETPLSEGGSQERHTPEFDPGPEKLAFAISAGVLTLAKLLLLIGAYDDLTLSERTAGSGRLYRDLYESLRHFLGSDPSARGSEPTGSS